MLGFLRTPERRSAQSGERKRAVRAVRRELSPLQTCENSGENGKMKKEFQQQLYDAAPILYGLAKDSPLWKISASDDLFPFLLELSMAIEKFNRRYRKRCVRVMRIRMVEGKL